LTAIETRLDQLQRTLADPDTDLSLVIAELRDVVAHLNGILQVSETVRYSMALPGVTVFVALY